MVVRREATRRARGQFPAPGRPRPAAPRRVFELPPSTASTVRGLRRATSSSPTRSRAARRAGRSGSRAARRSPSVGQLCSSTTRAVAVAASAPSITSRARSAGVRLGIPVVGVDVPAGRAVAGPSSAASTRGSSWPSPYGQRNHGRGSTPVASRITSSASRTSRCDARVGEHAHRRVVAGSGCRRGGRRRRSAAHSPGRRVAQRPWTKNVARTPAAASASRMRSVAAGVHGWSGCSVSMVSAIAGAHSRVVTLAAIANSPGRGRGSARAATASSWAGTIAAAAGESPLGEPRRSRCPRARRRSAVLADRRARRRRPRRARAASPRSSVARARLGGDHHRGQARARPARAGRAGTGPSAATRPGTGPPP